MLSAAEDIITANHDIDKLEININTTACQVLIIFLANLKIFYRAKSYTGNVI